MIARIFGLLRSLSDPLRSANAAATWIAALPEDLGATQKRALDAVGRFAQPDRAIGPNQVEGLLKVDARMEPVIAALTRDYTANYQKSTDVELKLWHLVFDLVKAFTAAYQAALLAGHPRAEDKRWRALLPWVLVRLAYYKGLDGKFRLFRYSRWDTAQWREFHELYEFARMRGWQREQLVLGAATFSRPGVSLEQEYLKTLLLMRLDSGNFTADQVEWIAAQLEDWSPTLMLVPPPGDGATFYVDLTGSQGLRRHDRPHAGGRILFLDVGPVYTRVIERMRRLPEQDAVTAAGEPPPRAQRLLLVRMAALFVPDTLAIAPRAVRHAVDTEVRVVFGLDALCHAIGEAPAPAAGDPASAAVTPATDGDTYGETPGDVAPAMSPAQAAGASAGPAWNMADASESGCRLTATGADVPGKLGDLLALRDASGWSLGVVRRMQRSEADEVTLGVEIIARRVVPVLLRTWAGSGSGTSRAAPGRPFFGIYLPARAENRQASQRSLIGPADRLVGGAMIELETGKARYLIRFTQIVEQQAGWSWALFSAVRNLTS